MGQAVTARRAPAHAGNGGEEQVSAGVLPRVGGYVWCAAILWLLGSNIVAPSFGSTRYQTLAALLAAAAILLLTLAVPWLLARLDMVFRRHSWVLVIGSVAGWGAVFAAIARLADAVRLPPDWDAYPVFNSAAALAAENTDEANHSYFRVNPNNVLLTLLLSRYLAAAEDLGSVDLRQSAAYLSAGVLFCGMILTYAAAAMIAGRQAARLTLVPSLALTGASPWLPVLYSDTAGLVFPVLILCLLLLAGKSVLWLRLVLWALAGALSAVGYGIKPTVLAVLAAAVLVGLFSLRGPTWKRQLLGTLLTAAVAAAAFGGMRQAVHSWEQSSGIYGAGGTAEAALPPTHFLKVGAQHYPGPYGEFYGAFNQADLSGTLESAPGQERFNAGLEAYRDRVTAMGPAGYAGFLNAKLRWITGDGSFFSWGEGQMKAENFLADDPLSRTIQDFYGPGRPGFDFLRSVWQGTWFIVLALCGAGLFLRSPALVSQPAAIARISLACLFVFLMFSEGRARFLYLYVPFFIVLGSLSLLRLQQLVRGHPARHRERRRGQAPSSAGEVVE